jgi:sugar/nucleoside kinase (ribokinase family)
VSKILVSGLINLETTLKIDRFPQEYFPVRYPFFGVGTTVSGVGYNVARALTTLGDSVSFLSLIGQDLAGQVVRLTMKPQNLPGSFVLSQLAQTPQSVILYDPDGRRQIHVDLKDIQEQAYPQEIFEQALRGCSLAVLCNINFSRPFLRQTQQKGIWVATDVHALESLNDPYNLEFMETADILFMSDERLPCPAEDCIRQVQNRFKAEIIVIGMGARGALLAVRSDRFIERCPAVSARPVVNTIGAGDALFSCFVHDYVRDRDPYQAIRKAIFFASYKIGANGAAEGFLAEKELESIIQENTHPSLSSIG